MSLTRVPEEVFHAQFADRLAVLKVTADAIDAAMDAIKVTVDALATAAAGATDGQIQSLKTALDAAVVLSAAGQPEIISRVKLVKVQQAE